MLISAHAVKGQGEVLGAGDQHAPHVASVFTTQGTKGRVTENDVIAVARHHGFCIQALESLVEAIDQSRVDSAHEAGPFPKGGTRTIVCASGKKLRAFSG
ncbi:hypothetical protein D3C77_598150 [compost metagenome]